MFRETLAPELYSSFRRRTRALACPVLKTLHEPARGQRPAHAPHFQESVVQLLPISLYPRAAGSMSRFFRLFGFPLAAVAASNGSNKALIVEDVYNPWTILLLSSCPLARRHNPFSLHRHGSRFCCNDK